MSLVALFGKMQEHELELSQLDQHEEQEKKKKKNISLKPKVDKYDSSGDESEKEEMEDMSLLMKRFTKNNESSTSNQNFTCFECGMPGHMKMECPNLKKIPFKGKKEIKTERRAYIAWEDNVTSSASEPENEE
ncbi:hypothetical protein Lal_00026998 [Lupinus albus]|nr:hypothetical protein Lal_00026998 [Lupinus albus]